MSQTKKSGQKGNRDGRQRARLIADHIGAKMAPEGAHSNVCTFRGKRAGIKSAAYYRGAGINVLDSMIRQTAITIAAFERPKNLWRVYSIKSANIPKLGTRIFNPKNAWRVTRGTTETSGALISLFRTPETRKRGKVSTKKSEKRQ